ncbi:MAG: hypothetical protein ACLT3D_08335 [Lawsonibacter sp.]
MHQAPGGPVLRRDSLRPDLPRQAHTPTASVSDEAARYVVTGISGTKTFNLAGLRASTCGVPQRPHEAVFDQFWMNMDIHRNNAFSSPPWRPPSTTARSGWSSCCPTCPPADCGGLLPGAHSPDQPAP